MKGVMEAVVDEDAPEYKKIHHTYLYFAIHTHLRYVQYCTMYTYIIFPHGCCECDTDILGVETPWLDRGGGRGLRR